MHGISRHVSFGDPGREDRDSPHAGAEAPPSLLVSQVRCPVSYTVTHILQQQMSDLLLISVFPKETRGSSQPTPAEH